MIREHLDTIRARLANVGLDLPEDAFAFSNDAMSGTPGNPDWATHKASDLAAAAGVKLNIKGLRHYAASQLLAARFDLRNTAARLGHGSGGATAAPLRRSFIRGRPASRRLSSTTQRRIRNPERLTLGHGRGLAARCTCGVGVVRPGAERRRGAADLLRERAARAGRPSGPPAS